MAVMSVAINKPGGWQHDQPITQQVYVRAGGLSVVKRAKDLTSEQDDMFQRLEGSTLLHSENAPDLDIELELMAAIKYAMRQAKQHGIGRERIVDRMNQCLPKEQHITLRQLNAWCAESKEFSNFPAKYLPAFVWACSGIVAPLDVITSSIGLGLVDEEDQIAAELGNTLKMESELRQRKRLLQKRMFRR
jgi:hypothetical protein